VYEIRTYKDGKIAKRNKVTIEAPKPKPKGEAMSAADVLELIQKQQQQTIAQVERIVEKMKAQ